MTVLTCQHRERTVVDEWDEVDIEGDGRASARVYKTVAVLRCVGCGHEQTRRETK